MGVQAEVVDRIYFKSLLGKTPNGKEIYLVRKENAPLRTLAFGSGGELPEALQGGYSSIKMAAVAVDAYITSLVNDKGSKAKGRSTNKK